MRSWGMLAAGGLGVLFIALGVTAPTVSADSLPPLEEWETIGLTSASNGDGGTTFTLSGSSGYTRTFVEGVTPGNSYSAAVTRAPASTAQVRFRFRFWSLTGPMDEGIHEGAWSLTPELMVASAPAGAMLLE
ncbi:MAG TPA: hypothetical protein PKD27_06435, partial [Tepidiformaceae bacterium]|nr:hypothetical protein [Tepidiformaceae bacterium]